MADKKISGLTSAGALAGTEPVPIVQGGVTVKTTVQDIADLATPATPDLQQVLDAGSVSTTGLEISDGTNSVAIKEDQIKIVNALADAVITSPNLTTTTTFELPNKLGGTETFAMLSDITGGGGDVYLANDQTFTGENTFAIASGNDTPIIITKGGNGAALKVTKSSGSGDAIEVAQGSVSIDDETASTIASFDANKRIKSLNTATYPSLTELSYVKGVTSSIQTQLNTASTLSIECISGTITTPVDATTYYWCIGGTFLTASTSVTGQGSKFAYNFELIGITIRMTTTTAGTNEDSTLYLRNITAGTSTLMGTFKTNGNLAYTSITGLTISCNTTDEYCLEARTPTWATNPANLRLTASLFLRRT